MPLSLALSSGDGQVKGHSLGPLAHCSISCVSVVSLHHTLYFINKDEQFPRPFDEFSVSIVHGLISFTFAPEEQ